MAHRPFEVTASIADGNDATGDPNIVARIILSGEPELFGRADWPEQLRRGFDDLLAQLQAVDHIESLDSPEGWE